MMDTVPKNCSHAQFHLQENRYELKYVISETCARGIRDFARSYLQHDPYADPRLDYAYAIHSLYLDSAGLSLCQATVNGHKNRFKLRLRYYDDKPGSAVFFEIKRRVNDAILKRRAAVRREAVAALLVGGWPQESDLIKPGDVKALDALRQFCDLRHQIRGEGQVIVSYHREAWVTPDNNSVRLTFDRNLTGTPWKGELLVPSFATGAHPNIGGVVLELKFTDRFPSWMSDLVRVFNLRRRSMPKYVECVRAVGVPGLALVDPGD